MRTADKIREKMIHLRSQSFRNFAVFFVEFFAPGSCAVTQVNEKQEKIQDSTSSIYRISIGNRCMDKRENQYFWEPCHSVMNRVESTLFSKTPRERCLASSLTGFSSSPTLAKPLCVKQPPQLISFVLYS